MRAISGPASGIVMMALSTACFTINDTLLKLAMHDLPPFEALFLRGVGSLLVGLPLLAATGFLRFAPLMLDRRVQLRNLLEIMAAMGFVVGLAHAPIADLTALGQTSPLLLLIGAALVFGEVIRPVQIGLIAVAFLGALMIAQPGLQGFSVFTLFGLWSAAAVAVRDLIGRRIDLAIPGVVVAVGAGAIEIAGAGLAGLALETWRMPTSASLLLAFGSSSFLIAAHWLLLKAYRAAPIASVAPFLYLSSIWALLAGWIVFDTVPNQLALGGIALIVLCGTLVVAAERWPRKIVVSP